MTTFSDKNPQISSKTDCVDYIPQYIDAIFIPREIFLRVCNVRDRTELFIWTFLRIIFISIIAYLVYDQESTLKIGMCSVMIIYIIINIILLLLIILKGKSLLQIFGNCIGR